MALSGSESRDCFWGSGPHFEEEVEVYVLPRDTLEALLIRFPRTARAMRTYGAQLTIARLMVLVRKLHPNCSGALLGECSGESP